MTIENLQLHPEKAGFAGSGSPIVNLADRHEHSFSNQNSGRDTGSSHLSSAQFKDGSITFGSADGLPSSRSLQVASNGPDNGYECRVDPMTLEEKCGS